MTAPPEDRYQRIDAVFDAALDMPTAEQLAFVERACADDEHVRDEVLELLRAHHRASGILESPIVNLAAVTPEDLAAAATPVPDRLGPFRLVREIGRGGMGQVYLAERDDGQFEQRVAIKVIRYGAPGMVRRFLDERRILARLQHPRIARLLDGGVTEGGLPYFVMELVEGEPIDRYCATRGLSLDDRLRLLIDVCEAVSHAHHHLVIHRDLKPSNILVTPDGQVKLLDFGIAKLLGAQGGDVTKAELRAMTPEFAAPEQFRGGTISTATDVYALGVLLYILVTGERPYDLRDASLVQVERIVCEHVPPRPSTRAPAALRRRVRGDLDLIVMTALHKQQERRYQSPGALAQDLARWRDGHPIVARPDSASYRMRKFVGRHRAGVAVGALLALALIGAGSRERVLRNRAELEARKAKEVGDFLVGVFDVADPMAAHGPDGGRVTARELLDRGAGRIDTTLADQPEVQAELRAVLGRVYSNLGLFDRAMPLLERSLAQRRALHGAVDADVASNMDLLGATLVRLSRFDEAERLLREALAQRRRLLGDRHLATAQTLEHLAGVYEERNRYADAMPMHREALAIRRAILGDTATEVAVSVNNLGLLRFRMGEYAAAESLYRQSLPIYVRRLGENHALTAGAVQNLAQVMHAQGKFDSAEVYHRRALAAKRKVLGDAHPSVTISLNNLGNLLSRELGRLEEGEALVREALALDRQLFGERHTFVAQGLGNLGVILSRQGRFPEAEAALREALDINRSLLGERHRSVATVYLNLGQVRYQLGADEEALAMTRRAYALNRELIGDAHQYTLNALVLLGRMLVDTRHAAEGEPLLRQALGRLDSTKTAQRASYISTLRTLGDAVLQQRGAAEALPILERALAMSRAAFADTSQRTANAQLTYGQALVAAGRATEAAPYLRAANVTLQRHRTDQPRLSAAAARAAAAAAAVQ